jgi:hypothetical protein
MISLLAGLVTSPSAVLAPYRAVDPQGVKKSATRERRAIIALVNAMFSVVGVGVAAWWATRSAGWSIEKVSAP